MHRKESPFAQTGEASSYLEVSVSTLFRYRKEGLLEEGKHWRRKWPSNNSPILYHLESCEKVLMNQFARDARTLEQASS